MVKVSHPALRCVCIAAHAPHTANDESAIEHWWKDALSNLLAHLRSWPLLLFADANAKVGYEACEHIGDYQGDAYNAKSEHFEAFVRECDLRSPSTFEDFQVGPGHTWRHPNGTMQRLELLGYFSSIACS